MKVKRRKRIEMRGVRIWWLGFGLTVCHNEML